MCATGVRDRDRIRWLHEVVTARGWRLDPFGAADVDDEGYPLRGQPAWFYPDSFGGVLVHQIEELSPQPVGCFYLLDADDAIVDLVIVPAGQEFACAAHANTGQHLALDSLPESLPPALEQAEQHARGVDPRALIACRFFGPCGDSWDAHGHRRVSGTT